LRLNHKFDVPIIGTIDKLFPAQQFGGNRASRQTYNYAIADLR